MAKIIALFNNKGGVSKTTTTFHLGWKLAEKGYKTLIVDTDPQCNLTGLCLNTDKNNKLDNFYKENKNNLKDSLSPLHTDLSWYQCLAHRTFCVQNRFSLFPR